MDIAVDTWPEIQRNRGYRPEFVERVRQERIKRQSEALKEQERSRALERLKKQGAPRWVADIIIAVSEERDVSPGDVVFRSHSYPVVDARHAAIYEVKATKESLSSTQIGKWFGVDHTTVLNALATHSFKTGAPKLTNYKLRPRYGYRAAEYQRAA